MNGVVQASIPTIHGLYDQYGSLFATDGTREIENMLFCRNV